MINAEKNSAKILLIEDEPDINLLAETTLKVKGFKVYCAFNGKDGIEIANNEPVDLIILDVSMPDMNGHDVIIQLKSCSKTKNIPVAFFSALVQKTEIKKGMELGAVGYISKPFDPELFPLEVGKFLRLDRKSTETQSLDKYFPDEILKNRYIKSMKLKLDYLEYLIAENEIEEITRFGHKIAGSGLSYGFKDITEIGYEIENAGEAGDIESVKILKEKLDKIISGKKANA